jgi:hypothetical protein
VEKPSFDEIVRAWRAYAGGRIPIASDERRNLLRDLFCTLQDYDMLDDLKLKSNQNRIVNASVNPTSKKLNGWKAMVEIDLDVVMQENEDLRKVQVANHKNRDYGEKAPDHKAYVSPVTTQLQQQGFALPKKEVKQAVANPAWEPTTEWDEDFEARLGLKKL